MGDCKPIVKFLQRSQVSTLLLILEALLTTGAQGAIVQRPKNLAVSVGGSSYFNCSTDGSGSINWLFSLNGNLGSSSVKEITSGNCDVAPGFSGNFRIEKPNSNVCNLIVFNASLQLGGYYACHTGGIGNSAIGQGILVVADTRSNITTNVTEFTNDCEDSAFFELTVNYSGPSPILPSSPPPALFPSLKWTLKSDPSNIISISDPVANMTLSSKIIVKPTIPSVPSYVCTLYFKPPTDLPPYCDNSTPSFTFNWETTAINTSCIELNASSITVTSYIESGICEAKILECRPYAYPPPHDIHWLDVIRNETLNGTRITAEFGGQYVCSVTNAINGHNHSANVAYRLNDDSAFTMDKCEGVLKVTITKSMDITSEIYKVEAPNKISLQSIANTYSCGIATGNVTATLITCAANGLPNPTYVWYDQCQNQISTDQQTIVTTSGFYTCVANNSINSRSFKNSNTTEITPSPAGASTGKHSDDGLQWLLLLILLLLVFLLPACVFLPYYGLSKSCRENVNDEFPWIEKALPCMNGKGCECSGGMVLFIFCLVICGIVFVPWILIASHCCQKGIRYADNSHNFEANGHPVPSHYQGLERNTQTTQFYEGLSQNHEYANAIGNDGFGRSLTVETNSHQQTQTPYEELQRNQQRPMVVYQELIP